jgi:membrane protease subunit (stomatin/prohibitin family)
MAFKDSLKRQLRSVIQWDNPDPAQLFYRWSDTGDEIKNASKLIVGPGQGCIFVYEGKVEALWDTEGMYEVKTANIPFLTTITKFMQAFKSEHKVGIYYYKTTNIADCKWGTPSPVKYIDPVYKFPVGLRARGNYTFRITDPKSFFVNFMGTRDVFLRDDIRDVVSARLLQPMGDYFAESGFGYNQIDAQREELAQGITAKIRADFGKFGFELTDFRIEGTDFDDETKKRVDRIADVSAEAVAANAAGVSYEKLQQLDALKNASKNPGGAGTMMGMGVGLGFGQGMAGMAAGATQAGAAAASEDAASKLKKLKEMLDAGLITPQDYVEKKKAILASM